MSETLSSNPEQGEQLPQQRLLDAAAQLTGEFGKEVFPDDPFNHRKYLHLPRDYYPQEWLDLYPQYDTISVNHHLEKDPNYPGNKHKVLTLAFNAQEGTALPGEACNRLFVHQTNEGELITSGRNGYRAAKIAFRDEELMAFADSFDRATDDLRAAQASSAP